MHIFWDHRQSSLKSLLNTFGMCDKTHGMMNRYGSHDTEDIPATQVSASLDLVPQDHPILERDNDTSGEYCEKLTLATPQLTYYSRSRNWRTNLQVHFPISTHCHPCHSSQINNSTSPWCSSQPPVQWGTSAQNHGDVHRHPACNAERIKPHNNNVPGYPHIWWEALLKARELAHGHPNRKSHMLAEAKPHSLTHMLTYEATHIGKCWHEIKDILRLKLCNANIHTSWFMEIQQKDNETLAAYIYCLKTAAKQCAFDNDTVAIHIFVKGFRDAPTITAIIYEKDPKLRLKSSD